MKLPDLDELLTLRGAARTLSLHAHGPARALLLGSHRSSHRGRGLEFEEVRPYVAGDDPRSIDWRVTARRGRVHTKLFREERERPVWLLVDLHPGMFFGSRRQLKSMAAVRAAALLAWVAAAGGDRVGAVIGNNSDTRVLPPRSREAGVLPVLNALLELQPRMPGMAQASEASGLSQALQSLAPLVHPGSLLLVLSDFAGLDAHSEARWSALAAHSECRWFWISDALEQHALPNGRFRAGVPDRIQLLDGAAVRPQWLKTWQQRAGHIQSLTQRLRISLLQLDTAQPIELTLDGALRASRSVA
jgi:uncharacterized protein (DUF58 family)